MDPVMGASAREDERMQRIVAAFGGGQILVDANGKVLWTDRAARRFINGGMQQLVIPDTAVADGVHCVLSSVQLSVHGRRVTVCVIREAKPAAENVDVIALIESAMADSAQWLTRNLVERVKALRSATKTTPGIGDLDVLSDREREVLGFICEGRSDLQMSEIMGLSHNTVRNHIASLYRKIGVNRRTAAIIWARERGVSNCDVLSRRQRAKSRPRWQSSSSP